MTVKDKKFLQDEKQRLVECGKRYLKIWKQASH